MPDATAIQCAAAEYHARPEWSQSQFKLLPHEPELFWGRYVAKLPMWQLEPTDDMQLGTQLHSVLLERQELLVIPPEALTSNGQRRGKAWDQWRADHADNPGILPRDAGRIQAMIAGARADPVVQGLVEADGEVEHTILSEDEASGLPLRCRLDKLARFDGGYQIADLKATSIDPGDARAVAAKIWTMKYHQQAACYIDAATLLYGPPLQFVFIFIRNRPPFNAVAWTLGDEDLALGRRHNAAALQDLKRRLESDHWTGFCHGFLNTVSLPSYAFADDPLDVSSPQPFAEFSDYE